MKYLTIIAVAATIGAAVLPGFVKAAEDSIGPVAAIVLRGDAEDGLTVRSRPSFHGRSVAYLKSGTPVANNNRFRDGWVELLAPHRGMWIHTAYLQPLRGNGEVIDGDPPHDRLRVRRGPGTSHPVVGYVDEGELVGLTGLWSETNWAEIDSPMHGWVFGDQILTDLFAGRSAAAGGDKAGTAYTAPSPSYSDPYIPGCTDYSCGPLAFRSFLPISFSYYSGADDPYGAYSPYYGEYGGYGDYPGYGGYGSYPSAYYPISYGPGYGYPGATPYGLLAALTGSGGVQVRVGPDGGVYVGVGGPYGVNVGVGPDGGVYVGVGGIGVGVGPRGVAVDVGTGTAGSAFAFASVPPVLGGYSAAQVAAANQRSAPVFLSSATSRSTRPVRSRARSRAVTTRASASRSPGPSSVQSTSRAQGRRGHATRTPGLPATIRAVTSPRSPHRASALASFPQRRSPDARSRISPLGNIPHVGQNARRARNSVRSPVAAGPSLSPSQSIGKQSGTTPRKLRESVIQRASRIPSRLRNVRRSSPSPRRFSPSQLQSVQRREVPGFIRNTVPSFNPGRAARINRMQRPSLGRGGTSGFTIGLPRPRFGGRPALPSFGGGRGLPRPPGF